MATKRLITSLLSLAALSLSLGTFTRESSAQTRGAKRGSARSTKKSTDSSSKKSSEPASTESAPASAETAAGSQDDPLKAIIALPPADRITRLQAYIDATADQTLKTRASELMVSARAALGDELLRQGDAAGGVEQFREAISSSPSDMSDKLYYDVVSQIPLNLYLRGQRDAAIDAAHMVEALVRMNPSRTLALGSFFLRVEEPAEALRLADIATKLAPDNAAAHQMFGTAHLMSFQFEEAIAEFARALELDPKSATARASLADLKRATGKPEEALALYRELQSQSPQNKTANAGVVLSLLELGRKDEAEREMTAALSQDQSNLPLLAGAAYWYAAHSDGARADEFGQRAIAAEPRYIWGYIALARALAVEHKPFNSDGLLYYARKFGNFPTLDYELASALSTSGLYEEAAAALSRSFSIRGGKIQTRLANRLPAQAGSFTELLAPERRASIFQPVPADSEENARSMKALVAFHQAMTPANDGARIVVDESGAVAAAKEFASGSDEMRIYRQLYAAERLVTASVGLTTVVDLMEAATDAVEPGLDAPTATIATLADDLREIRARAIAVSGTPNIADLERTTRSYVLRGRIEDISGLAYMKQGKTAEATTHFKRAVSVLPPTTYWGRLAYWHLGDALRASGNEQDALANYLKAYNPEEPDAVKRAVIQTLYQKVNGSLDGLDAKIGPAVAYQPANQPASAAPEPSASQPPAVAPSPAPATDTEKRSSTADSFLKQPERKADQTEPPALTTEPPAPVKATGSEVSAEPPAAQRDTKSAETPAPAVSTETNTGKETTTSSQEEPPPAPSKAGQQRAVEPPAAPSEGSQQNQAPTTDTAQPQQPDAQPPAAAQPAPDQNTNSGESQEQKQPVTRPRRVTKAKKP
jgi:tetratricopeptide (TPR) repeat protein